MQNKVILQIYSITRKISKRQAEFNRLTQKIEELNAMLSDLKEGYDTIHSRVVNDALPLQKQMVADRITIVKQLDNLYSHDIFRSADRKKLAQLLKSLSFELIRNDNAVELIPIFNLYSEVTYDNYLEDISIQSFKTTPENAIDNSEEGAQSEEEWVRYSYKVHSEKKGISEKAARKDLQEKKQTKSVRSVYLDLVKAFHPDREMDEQEKERKTEIMGRVTEAYRANDLLLLLNLQMEYNHIDQNQLNQLADEQLLYYNKVLKQQVDELEKQKKEILQDLAQMLHLSGDQCDTFEKIQFQFNKQMKSLKSDAKNLKQDINSWADPYVVKEYLKTI